MQKNYIFYFSNPLTNELIFNIEMDYETNELKINYGKNVTVSEACKEFFNFFKNIENHFNGQKNIKIPPGTKIEMFDDNIPLEGMIISGNWTPAPIHDLDIKIDL